MTENTMSLYREYLDAKSELISKDLKFKRAAEKWFIENPKIILIQPLAMVDSITMDHLTIVATSEFQTYLQYFEETFEVKCVRIHHRKIITP